MNTPEMPPESPLTKNPFRDSKPPIDYDLAKRKHASKNWFWLALCAVIRDWRTTIIATLAIPTSIIPTFLLMQLMGFSLINITMLGLILSIGIVIDDAVVEG